MTRLSPAGEAINECPATTGGYITHVDRRNQQGAAVVDLCKATVRDLWSGDEIASATIAALDDLTVVPISDERLAEMIEVHSTGPDAILSSEQILVSALRELQRRREADR